MSSKQILTLAKAKLPNPHNWIQGRSFGEHWAPDGKTEQCMCAGQAIVTAAVKFGREDFDKAVDRYRVAAKIGPNDSIASWNDAKWRTYDEVMTAFDKAIELAP